MRKVIAVALSCAVQAAVLGAPLAHAHPDEHATAHHAGRTVHTHWAGHDHHHEPSDSPALDAVDGDRALFLTAFAAVTVLRGGVAGSAPAVVVLPVPVERPAHRVIEIAPGHDPPTFGSVPSRAPPRLPVLI